MKGILAPVVLAMALTSPAFAQQDHHDGQQTHDGQETHGAPAPLLGAGVPGVVMGISFGIYWLARRRRNAG